MTPHRPAYIVGGRRIPFVKSMTKYMGVTTQELMTESLEALVKAYKLEGKIVGDVALGAVMLSASNWNLARECVLGSSLHPYTPAYNVQRACGTSLETTWQLCMKIAHHQCDDAISGGVDTNSDIPVEVSDQMRDILLRANAAKGMVERLKIFSRFRFQHMKPKIAEVVEPRSGLSMGEHCELMVKEWKIPREDQDQIAYSSHMNGSRAYKEGFYNDLVVPFNGLTADGTLRGDTSLEKLAKLKPVFDRENGRLTAGNSSPLTDGSSAVLLASEESMKKNNWQPLARFVDAQAAAVNFVKGDGLLMGPTIAVSKLLQRNNLSLQDFDFYEIHEAFAGQVLCNLKAWETDEYCKKYLGRNKAMGPIDRSKLNIVGGSVAMGHPFAATGTRIVATLAKLLATKQKARGLISICTAGGMGVAAILESV
jgi:acetyl-CoA C-acetyltransferase